jgi:hypothetical protein
MTHISLGTPLLMDALFFMETSAQYRETSAQYSWFAEECDRLAKQAKTDGERKTLEEMAKAWRMVAAEADNER